MNNSNMNLENNGLYLNFKNENELLKQYYFGLDGSSADGNKMYASPNFRVAISGVKYGAFTNETHAFYNLAEQMKLRNITDEEQVTVIEYFHPIYSFSVTVKIEKNIPAKIFRQVVSMKNESNSPMILTHLSSLFITGIATEGKLPWDTDGKIKIHFCTQAWEGEGQWKSIGLEEAGIYHTSMNLPTAAFHISSVGSWSTGRFVPIIMIEDTEMGEIWYSQLETSSSWHISTGYISGYYSSDGSLYIQMDAADEKYGSFRKKLLPGESFVSQPSVYGCCQGSFADAVKELTKYKRNYLLPKYSHNLIKELPVVFNDYMNCLWADSNDEKLIPLIDTAEKLGIECFCIDAGWFSDKGINWSESLGDWKTNSNRYGKYGLSGILKYIRSKGMIPGIWLELEVCGEQSEISQKDDSWFLLRDGIRVGGGQRCFLNFQNPDVRRYLHQKIDDLVDIGVGFIKNDYNDCVGVGANNNTYSYGEGILENARAFYSFIDEVRERHPDLVLENCASGAMRQDYAILTHFHLQSISDQEFYYKMPSIIIGSLANLLPEQTGIWAYPISVLSKYKDDDEYIHSEEFIKSFSDGEETIFNMINGLCGVLYLSGRIDLADQLNLSLIKEGIDLYKKLRLHNRMSFPLWPSGMLPFNKNDAWCSFALSNEDGTYITVAVWKMRTDTEEQDFDFPFLIGKDVKAAQIFPKKRFESQYSFDNKTGKFTVKMDGYYKARFYELRIG